MSNELRYREALELIAKARLDTSSQLGAVSMSLTRIALEALNPPPQFETIGVTRWLFYKQNGDVHSGYELESSALNWYSTLTEETKRGLYLIEMVGSLTREIKPTVHHRELVGNADSRLCDVAYDMMKDEFGMPDSAKIFAEWETEE